MKKILLLLISCYSMVALGQNLINPITITLPANPPANTADWATAMPPVMVVAQTKMQNGQINGTVIESRILVTIKSGGNKICGTYTQQTAPSSNFNTVTKTWTGAAFTQLLGQECILKPGSYELCVQFFSLNAAVGSRLLGEACKAFTVADKKQQTYSPPQNVQPADGKEFTKEEAKQPINFRWTPVLPKPKAKVKYTVRVWDIPIRANKNQVIKTQAPAIIKETEELTQLSIPASEFKLGRRENSSYAWNVQASKQTQMGDVEMLGTSEATSFRILVDESNPGSCLSLDTSKYTIVCVGQDQDGKFRYRVQNLFVNKVTGNSDPFMESGTIAGTVTTNNNYITTVLPPAVVVQNITPAAFTGVTSTSSPAIGFDFVSATPLTSFTVNLSTYTYHLSAAGSKIHCQKNFEMTFDVPSCKCDLCDEKAIGWEIQNELYYDSAKTNNILTLHNNISVNPSLKVVKLSAEVIDFYWYTEGDCKKCNNNDFYWGNIINGSIEGSKLVNQGTSVADENGIPLTSSHQLDFISSNPSGTKLSSVNTYLNISLPPQTTLSCCIDCFRFCVRYTITFLENGVCKTCSIVKCYETKRQHRKTGKQLWLQTQLNECGEKIQHLGGGAVLPDGIKQN